MIRRLALALLLLWLAPATALALPPVWVVRDKDSQMVLFGSVHLLPPGLDWRPKALEQALTSADDIWFEAPMGAEGQQDATTAAQEHALLPAGQKLSALLSEAGRDRLAKAAAKLGMSQEDMDRLQPWYAELMLSNALYQKVGAERSQGVELQLWQGVNPDAKRVTFETPAEQVALFAAAPMADQVASLEETLKEAPSAEHDYHVLLKAWMGADLKTLDRKVVEPLRKTSPALYATLVRRRNMRWTQALDKRLQGSGRSVVVVGMGHLIGPDGLPARLRALGYSVEGP
jgi:hypothetical protein